VAVTYSVVVPVYRNAGSLKELIEEMADLADRLRRRHGMDLEVVFVVDGSPDESYEMLAARLPHAAFPSKLLAHSRNFGSFAAIRTGLHAAGGDYIGVMAADLQEPIDLQESFAARLLAGDCDVVVAARAGRADPLATRVASAVFWRTYRRLVDRAIPASGVDVFACTRGFRDELLRLPESHTSLVGLIYWLGFRRAEVTYERQRRRHGTSAWSIARRVTYLADSVFSFTDLPVRLLAAFGLLGIAIAVVGGLTVLLTRLLVGIPVPGYAAVMLAILFFGGLNALGLGIIGFYVCRAFENTKRRPLAVVMRRSDIPGAGAPGGEEP
jgi:glycosyltransferase involved in cell wall biosynthesis